jgi:hypothetical protein
MAAVQPEPWLRALIINNNNITNNMQRYTIGLFLQNALHVSGGSSARHQELKLYIQHLVFVKLLLLPFIVVQETELLRHLLLVPY